MNAETQDPWREVTAARLPAEFLHLLAPLRDQMDVRVQMVGTAAWVRWPQQRAEIVRRLLGIPGIEFYTQRGNMWSRFGSRLPAEHAPPAGAGVSLANLLTPARFEPMTPTELTHAALTIRAVRGGEPQAATALMCTLHALRQWGEMATTAELAAVRGARRGERALLLSAKLPALATATRYWGESLLLPVGFRAEPNLSVRAIRTAIGAADHEIGLLDEHGAQLIPLSAFEPLTRAGLRLAGREVQIASDRP